jgi:DinB superfamily
MPIKADAKAASFYQSYLDLVTEDDPLMALKKSSRQFRKFLEGIPKNKINFAYAPGKWTIKEILQHVIDAERVFSYRALSFSRKDMTALPGFEEKSWASNAQTVNRKWKDLLEEFKTVRKSTEILFGSFAKDQLLAEGIASNNPINNLALGYVCSGHVLHHMNIIKERYL